MKIQGYTEVLRKHYLRNNAFFFIACMCGIYAGSYLFSSLLAFAVLIGRTIEIFGLYWGRLWICYLAHAVFALGNYANIIFAFVKACQMKGPNQL